MVEEKNKKMKLLLIGPLPPPYAGPEIGTRFLLGSKALNDAFEIQHINTTLRNSNAERGHVDITMILAFLKYIPRLLGKLIFFRPDVVFYTIMSATWKGWVRDSVTIILAAVSGRPPIMQFRGGHFRYFYEALPPVRQKIVRTLLNRSGLILAQADVLRRQFEGIVPESRIGRLYNCVAPEFFDYFDSIDRHNRSGPVRILFVGHLSQAKGYCDLLKVFPALANKHDIEISCLGATLATEHNVFFNQATGEPITHADPDDCYREYIENHGYENKFRFLGDRVDGQAKMQVFADADIFVLPSYSEGFSMAILEAFAASLPVVVTAVGAAPEIVDDGRSGFVIIPGEIDTLRSKLEILIENPDLRARMGRAARERCRADLVGDAAILQLIGQFKRLNPTRRDTA